MNLTEAQVSKMIKDALNERENYNAFNVTLIPAHAHTGVDSQQIDGANLAGTILARTLSYTSTGTTSTGTAFTPPANGIDLFDVTSLGATGTFNAPYGQPVNGALLRIRITSSDASVPRALVWSATGYISNSPTLPTLMTTGKTTSLGFEYDTSNSVNKWRLIWSANS